MHTIRLRSVWNLEQNGADVGRVNLPLSNLGAGPVVLRRSFNRPTGLSDSTSIRLSLPEMIADRVCVELNEQLISKADGLHAPSDQEIASLLQQSNQLVLRMEGENCGINGEVVLQISE